jgi:hypothetical protein
MVIVGDEIEDMTFEVGALAYDIAWNEDVVKRKGGEGGGGRRRRRKGGRLER